MKGRGRKMDDICNLINELLPGHTIRTHVTDADNTRLYNINVALHQECLADLKLIQVLHVTGESEFLAQLLRRRRQEYYLLYFKDIATELPTGSAECRSMLERLQDGSCLECDMCKTKSDRTCECPCKYILCDKCSVTLVYNALREAQSDVFYCPQCHLANYALSGKEGQEGYKKLTYADMIKKLRYVVEAYSGMELITEDFANEMFNKINKL